MQMARSSRRTQWYINYNMIQMPCMTSIRLMQASFLHATGKYLDIRVLENTYRYPLPICSFSCVVFTIDLMFINIKNYAMIKRNHDGNVAVQFTHDQSIRSIPAAAVTTKAFHFIPRHACMSIQWSI